MKIVKRKIFLLFVIFSLFFNSSFAFNFFKAIKKPWGDVLQFWKKKKVKKPIETTCKQIVDIGMSSFALPFMLLSPLFFWLFMFMYSRGFRNLAFDQGINSKKSVPVSAFYLSILLPIKYYTGWRVFNIDSQFEKLSKACRYTFNGTAKSMLNGVDDINAVFGERDRNHNYAGLAPIHIAVDEANLEVLRWLVEEKFADITAQDNRGRNVFYHASHGHFYNRLKGVYSSKLVKKIENYWIGMRMNSFLLMREVKLVRYGLDNPTSDLAADERQVKRSLRWIKNSMNDSKIAGIVKQVIVGQLAQIYKRCPNLLAKKDIIDFYKKIVFNYTFLNDKRLRKAAIFAGKRNIKDMNGKTVLQVYAQYGQDSGLLAQIVSNKVSEDKTVIKNYLSYKPDPRKVKDIYGKFFVTSKLLLCSSMKNVANKVKNLFCTKKWDTKKEGLDYLIATKKVGNKRAFRDFVNSEIVKKDLTRAPGISGRKNAHKAVANILEFTGADFGNKLYHRK